MNRYLEKLADNALHVPRLMRQLHAVFVGFETLQQKAVIFLHSRLPAVEKVPLYTNMCLFEYDRINYSRIQRARGIPACIYLVIFGRGLPWALNVFNG